MITFEPVWISTDEHMKKLYAIYKQASTLDKILGIYNLPPNFPQAQMVQGLLPFFNRKVPIVAIASGLGEIGDTEFSFQSKPFHIFGSITKNLMDLEFKLSKDELIEVTHAKADSPIIQYYSTPFTRVRTTREGLLSNFLVCVGGRGPSMKEVNAKSSELFRGLESLMLKE